MGDLLNTSKGDVRLGHEASCVFSAVVSKVFDMNTADIPGANALKTSWSAHDSNGVSNLENAKRPSSCHSLDEAVFKRARHEDQCWKVEQFLDIPAFCVTFGQKPSLYIHGEEDLYSPFAKPSYWKHVPIGPGHQADVPEFRSCRQSGCGASSPSKSKTSSVVDLEYNENGANKWLGACVMPMPDLESISVEAQSCKSIVDCYCEDAGSIRCVRSHIMEARENLERTLGLEKFMKLGFCDIGETVAQKWRKDEEDLFRQVVLMNPASLGRNFWTMLSLSFPTRSVKEIVSYYFNVFILRNRAEQNRSDPLHADSDNDEWQESSEEEDEDSLVESPIDGDDAGHESDFLGQDETDSEVYEQCDVRCEEDDGLNGGSDEYGVYESKSGKNSSYAADDRDVQAESCTSSEDRFDVVGFSLQCSQVKHDHESLHAECINDCGSALTDYDCIDGHYIGATEKVVEFLPTCYVIEEMLGKES